MYVSLIKTIILYDSSPTLWRAAFFWCQISKYGPGMHAYHVEINKNKNTYLTTFCDWQAHWHINDLKKTPRCSKTTAPGIIALMYATFKYNNTDFRLDENVLRLYTLVSKYIIVE